MQLLMFTYNQSILGFLFIIVLNEGIFCRGADALESNCPDGSPLTPCICSDASDGSNIDLDCSDATSEVELQDFFDNFTVSNVHQLTIANNGYLIRLLGNIFGDVTFEIISFTNDVIEFIDENSFLKSNSTLVQWRMEDCMLLPQGFPFHTMRYYLFLDTLELKTAGKFNVLPRLTSNSLTTLSIIDCELMYLEQESVIGLPNLAYVFLYENSITFLHPGIFDCNPLLEQVYLYDNHIGDLELGTFRNLPNLALINLGNNNISHITPGAFINLPKLEMLYLRNNRLNQFLWEAIGDLPSLTNLYIDRNEILYFDGDFLKNCPNIQYVFAGYNALTSIPQGTFDNLHSGYLILENNFLTELNETWLLSVLQNNNYAFLSYNPLECGCDMAWLFNDASLLNSISATCANGTSIRLLDPSYFINNC